MTLGAGRVIFQDLTRINRSIKDKTFFSNETITKTFEAGKNKTGRVHLMGLVSDGGVHSDLSHLLALLDFAVQKKVPHVSVHCFMDGRDTPPSSGIGYVQRLLEHPAFQPGGQNGTQAQVGVISGRYWAMDRDQRWERVARAYAALTGQVQATALKPLEAIEHSYKAEKTDEFMEPVLLSAEAAIHDGDSAFFFNFRSDRAREISQALTAETFEGFDRGKAPRLSAFAGMTVYDKKAGIPAAFPPQSLENILGEWLEKKGLSQFRIAETEKYAHVTFFFNGGREKPFEKEERVLIPSPKEVPTYDLKPEMSAIAVTENAVERINATKPDFVLLNFANPDMIGHTGNYDAAIKALETIDKCLVQLMDSLMKNGYHVLVTADHGNAEELRDANGEVHTQHTLNPVPITWVAAPSAKTPKSLKHELKSGGLADVMPTVCAIMDIGVPAEATGKNLVVTK
jgi:2,3-bisphosphoglycerate-independent phosphoglycerate mutase